MDTSHKSVDLHTVGQVLTVLSVAKDVYGIGSAVIQDYSDGTKHNTVHTTSAVVGSRVGKAHGADLGARLFADTSVGALAGGIIGGIIGSFGGGFLASKAAEVVMPAPEEK